MSMLLSTTTVPLLLQITQPVILTADLDEDGVVEEIQVAFSPMRELQVTVVEPDGTRSTLNLGAFPDHDRMLEEAVVSLPSPDETGVPLLRVQAASAELSAAWDHDIFVSYNGDHPQVAIETISSASPHPRSTQAVAFSPGARALLHTAVYGDSRIETRHTFRDGVYVQAP